MASISFQEIYSRFYTKVEAYDLFDEGISDEARNELLCSYVHAAIGKPYISRLFSFLDIDDPLSVDGDLIDGQVNYILKRTTDDFSDKEFLIELIAYGMALSWVEPKVASLTNIAQFIGTSDERWFSAAQHLKELQELRDSLLSAQRGIIRDRGYVTNAYLDRTFR